MLHKNDQEGIKVTTNNCTHYYINWLLFDTCLYDKRQAVDRTPHETHKLVWFPIYKVQFIHEDTNIA